MQGRSFPLCIALCLFVFVCGQCGAKQHVPIIEVASDKEAQYAPAPPNAYDLIGPFVTGEREEGIDTLESYGGVFSLQPSPNATFPSELSGNGTAQWSRAYPDANYNVQISYANVNWSFLTGVFGWSVWLWYGYAVGSFQVDQAGRYLVSCTGVRDFYVDSRDNLFSGDFYSYGVGPHTVNLTSGLHVLYVRLASSVRLTQSPVVNFNCGFLPISGSILVIGDTTVPDIVNGYLTTPFVSLTISNVADGWLHNVVMAAPTFGEKSFPIDVAPNQKVPLYLLLPINVRVTCPLSIPVTITSDETQSQPTFYNLTLECATFQNGAYKFTFLDYDNTVQYASIKPPPSPCQAAGCPVMFATHGAGLEASTPAWTGEIPALANLWILFPTGRRPWGYDWESSSRVNAFTALRFLASALPGVPTNVTNSYKIDASRLLYVGHSMGGHGCWHLTSHFGDRALASACAAGFVKLQFYAFYNTRAGESYVDPLLRGILQSSIAEHDNDLYSTNMAGIPIIARYGQDDDNVCPWHSRRMARMVDEVSGNANAVIISEVPGQGHWFDGVLGSPYMQSFYLSHNVNLPPVPESFTLTVLNPASSEGRGFLQVIQLLTTYRAGRIYVRQSGSTWHLQTENIRRFGVAKQIAANLIIDGASFLSMPLPEYQFCKLTRSSSWQICKGEDYVINERSPINYGPIRQFFERQFIVVYGTQGSAVENSLTLQKATYISNFYNNYGRGYAQILPDTSPLLDSLFVNNVNVMLLGGPAVNLLTNNWGSGLSVNLANNLIAVGPATYGGPCQGVIFLSRSPLPGRINMLLVVAGTDTCGFTTAVRALPQRSGVLVPDYLVVSQSFIGMGAGGILAAGFWDNTWNFSPESGYVR